MQYIDQTVEYVIRPTRDRYHINRLGTNNFTCRDINNQQISISRQDSSIIKQSHNQSYKIQFSYYYRSNTNINHPKQCIIYLHANNGSRVEALPYIMPILSDPRSEHYTICTFDNVGSGLSEGDYVTLGINEADDIYQIVKNLYAKFGVSNYLLWGRSMGACSAIVFQHRYRQLLNKSNIFLRGIILDSAFSSLKKLIRQLASMRTKVPQMFLGPFLMLVEKKLKERIGLQFQQYEMNNYIKQANNVPALFLVSKTDKLVKFHHTQLLYNEYQSPQKDIFFIGFQHHENRSQQVIEKCMSFIHYCFQPKILGQQTDSRNQRVINSHKSLYNFPKKRSVNKFSFSSQKQINPPRSPTFFTLCPTSKNADEKQFNSEEYLPPTKHFRSKKIQQKQVLLRQKKLDNKCVNMSVRPDFYHNISPMSPQPIRQRSNSQRYQNFQERVPSHYSEYSQQKQLNPHQFIHPPNLNLSQNVFEKRYPRNGTESSRNNQINFSQSHRQLLQNSKEKSKTENTSVSNIYINRNHNINHPKKVISLAHNPKNYQNYYTPSNINPNYPHNTHNLYFKSTMHEQNNQYNQNNPKTKQKLHKKKNNAISLKSKLSMASLINSHNGYQMN